MDNLIRKIQEFRRTHNLTIHDFLRNVGLNVNSTNIRLACGGNLNLPCGKQFSQKVYIFFMKFEGNGIIQTNSPSEVVMSYFLDHQDDLSGSKVVNLRACEDKKIIEVGMANWNAPIPESLDPLFAQFQDYEIQKTVVVGL